MKNLKLNKNIINIIKKGIALVSAVTCVASFAGCKKEGWPSDDYEQVQAEVSMNIEARKEEIISDCIKKYKNESDDIINLKIYEELARNNLLSSSDKESYKKLLAKLSNYEQENNIKQQVGYSYTK